MDFMISNFDNQHTTNSMFGHRGRSESVYSDESVIDLALTDNSNHQRLPPEVEEGNVEYKVKLVNPSSSRMQHLITQMKWRLREGQGEAIYEIGVEDNGRMAGLTDKEMEASLATLREMASALNASSCVLSEREIKTTNSGRCRRRVFELLIRKVPDNRQFIELRIAVLGGQNSGKSTLCGVLIQGLLDNGHGKARLNVFRHPHEFQTGRTSSICLDFIGFDSTGRLLNHLGHSHDEIMERSTKLITLIDLAGDRRYLKTTIYGLTAYLPHYAALVVSATKGPTSITREHLGLAIALNIPIFVVITKIDAVNSSAIEKLLRSIEMLVERPGMERNIRHVKNIADAVSCASSMLRQDLVPIFLISNVAGNDLYLLKHFLNVLPPSGYSKSKQEQLSSDPPLFSIDEVYRVSNTDVVACGVLTNGLLFEKERIRVGPFKDGVYRSAVIRSIRRNRQPVRSIRPGEAASIAVELDDQIFESSIRRGMVLLNEERKALACKRFIARLYLLYHPTTEICVGFQGTVYAGSVRQTATIVNLEAPSLEPCKWTIVHFELYSSPEYICVGTPLIFREGKTKGMGEVIQVFDIDLIG